MKHQYFRDDLVVAHKFYNKNGDAQEWIPVPEHVRLCFFTAPEAGVIYVERNGDICDGCRVTADGMILSASVSLSRTCIGKGPLMCLVQEFKDDPAFPQGVMINSMPVLLDVVLGDIKSDDAGEISSDVTFGELARILDDVEALNTKVEQQDGSIFDLYAKIRELDAMANNAVDLNTEQTITASKKFTVAPVMQGGLSMADTRIRKLATPLNSDDAVNKSYVDLSVSKIPVEAGDGTLAIKTRGVSHDASGNGAVAVGIHKNIASGENSHAEGKETKAYSKGSHAEGYQTIAGDLNDPTTDHNYSHSEGHTTQAIGKYSHSEGYGSIANGNASHAEGYSTVTNNRAELSTGHFNKSNKQSDTYGNAGNTTFSIGIGTSDTVRKNAVEVMQNGDVYVIGVGNYQGDNPASSASLANFINTVKETADAKANVVDISNYLTEGAVLPYPAVYRYALNVPHMLSFRKYGALGTKEEWYIVFCATHIYPSEYNGYEYLFYKRDENDNQYKFFKRVNHGDHSDDEWYKLGATVFNEDLRENKQDKLTDEQIANIAAVPNKVDLVEISSINNEGSAGTRFPFPAMYSYYGGTLPHAAQFSLNEGEGSVSYIVLCLWHTTGGYPAAGQYALFRRSDSDIRPAYIEFLRYVGPNDEWYSICQAQFHDDLPAKVTALQAEVAALKAIINEITTKE